MTWSSRGEHGNIAGHVDATPLFRFFLLRRMDRAQLVFLFLYLAGAAHLNFFSLSGSDPAWLLGTWLPLLLPLWLIDGEMQRSGAVRVFVWPRQHIRVLTTSYLAARVVRGMLLGAFLASLTLNIRLLQPGLHGGWVVIACAGMGLFVASFVTVWNILAGGRTVYPAVYAAGAALIWLFARLAHLGIPRGVLEAAILPYWLLDPVGAGDWLSPGNVAKVITASAVWMTIAFVVFHHAYRGRRS